jgi:putative hydrolase of the HAD superfamily
MQGISGGFAPRPEMTRAIGRLRDEGLRVGALTNNWARPDAGTLREPLDLGFDVVVESAVEGIRKPDPRIYALVCDRLDVTPPECVFLDDLGVNLKPARAMGMTTIKVLDPHDALAELAGHLDLDLLPA